MGNTVQSYILKNARVWTGDDTCPTAAAVGVVGDTIAAVGDVRSVREAVARGAQEADLGGKALLPGFIDNHVHFMKGGEYLLGLDLRGAATPEEFVRRIRVHAEKSAGGTWVVGGRWDSSKWPGGAWPHKDLLEGCPGDVPIFVKRTDGHMGLANRRALGIAGITGATPDPIGGTIDKDASGEPTGLLRDAAMDLVQRHIPEPDEAAKEAMVVAALRHAASLGVTGVDDMDSRGAFPVYQRLLAEDRLTCRINYWFGMSKWEDLLSLGLRGGFGGDSLRIAGVKAFLDGSLGARTARMFQPYEDAPHTRGLVFEWVSNGKLREQLTECDRAGIQVAVHAVGDEANAMLLDMAEATLRQNGGGDRRLRSEHAQHVRRQDIRRFAQLGVIASVQPPHVLLDAPWIEKAIGRERAHLAYAFRSFLDAGVRVSFGTDWPVAPMAPLEGIWAAVTRVLPDGDRPGPWHPEERVTVEEAVRCWTIESAYAQFQERRKGSITPGKLADMVLLSEDILATDPMGIRGTEVLATFVGGRVVYQKEKIGNGEIGV